MSAFIWAIGPAWRADVWSAMVGSGWSMWMGNITKGSRVHFWAGHCSTI